MHCEPVSMARCAYITVLLTLQFYFQYSFAYNKAILTIAISRGVFRVLNSTDQFIVGCYSYLSICTPFSAVAAHI